MSIGGNIWHNFVTERAREQSMLSEMGVRMGMFIHKSNVLLLETLFLIDFMGKVERRGILVARSGCWFGSSSSCQLT